MQKKENNREPKENKRYKANKDFTGDYTNVDLQFHHCYLPRTGTMTAEHVYSFKSHKNILILTENDLVKWNASLTNGKSVSKQA